mgnify:CR=1 FL=1
MSQSFEDALKMVPCHYDWQESIVSALIETGTKVGPKGILILISAIKLSLKVGQVPDFSKLSLRSASDLTALLQVREAEFKAEVEDFLGLLKSVLLSSILSF